MFEVGKQYRAMSGILFTVIHITPRLKHVVVIDESEYQSYIFYASNAGYINQHNDKLILGDN